MGRLSMACRRDGGRRLAVKVLFWSTNGLVTEEMPSEAGVVIIGGGIAGCALAHQLAEQGVAGVVLLEQNQLAAGTTWHAAGAVGRMRLSASLARLNDRSAALYARVTRESGRETGWR